MPPDAPSLSPDDPGGSTAVNPATVSPDPRGLDTHPAGDMLGALAEQRLRVLVDHAPDWDFWRGPDGRYCHVSSACEAVCGYPPAAFLDDPNLMERLLSPADLATWRAHLSAPAASAPGTMTGSHTAIQLRLRTRGGGERWIEHRCQRVYDTDGSDLGRRGVNHDITALKIAEQALTHATCLYATLGEFNQALLQAPDADWLCWALCRIVVETGGLKACIVSPSGSAGHLSSKASAGLDPNLAQSMPLLSAHQLPADAHLTPVRAATAATPATAEFCPTCTDRGVSPQWQAWADAVGVGAWCHLRFDRGGEPAGLVSYLASTQGDLPDDFVGLLGELTRNLSFGLDYLDRRASEEAARAALAMSESRLKVLLQSAPVGIGLVVDRVLVEANDRLCALTGYPREALLDCPTRLLFPDDAEFRRLSEELCPLVVQDGSAEIELRVRRRDGQVIDALLTTAALDRSDLGRGLVSTLRDVTQARRDRALMEARLTLAGQAAAGDLGALLRTALETAERLTESRVSFIHFVDPDQERLSLQAWSADTLVQSCTVSDLQCHVPLRQAGAWADCARQRAPVVHNACPALTHHQALPPGSPPVSRELTVPVEQGERLVGIMGVGNKSQDYTAADVAVVLELAVMTMDRVADLRADAALRRAHARLLEAQRVARLGDWRLDLTRGRVEWSPQVYAILGLDPDREPPGPEADPALIHPADLPRFQADIARALADGTSYAHDLRICRPDGTPCHIHARGHLEWDDQDRAVALYGTVQDISDHKRAQERLDFLAHHDDLTRLPNRALLQDRLDHAIQRALREGSHLALLFLDLDGFKAVNDRWGHAAGDRLLVAVAQRLTERLRAADTLARHGGDEFLILLEGSPGAAGAATAAAAYLAVLTRPFCIDDYQVQVSASIGIALYPTDGADGSSLLRSADQAMYQAKNQGPGHYQFYTPEQ